MRKTVSITLDRERLMKLDLNAMSEFEEITGRSLFTIGADISQAKYIRAIIYSCLKSAKEQITLEEVGELIDADNLAMINERLNALMEKSYDKNDESEDTKKK
jgi:hypothetical protein